MKDMFNIDELMHKSSEEIKEYLEVHKKHGWTIGVKISLVISDEDKPGLKFFGQATRKKDSLLVDATPSSTFSGAMLNLKTDVDMAITKELIER